MRCESSPLKTKQKYKGKNQSQSASCLPKIFGNKIYFSQNFRNRFSAHHFLIYIDFKGRGSRVSSQSQIALTLIVVITTNSLSPANSPCNCSSISTLCSNFMLWEILIQRQSQCKQEKMNLVQKSLRFKSQFLKWAFQDNQLLLLLLIPPDGHFKKIFHCILKLKDKRLFKK